MSNDITPLVEGTYASISIHIVSPQTNLRASPRNNFLYIFESDLGTEIFRREVRAPCVSLIEWSRRCIDGYTSGKFLPYPEYVSLLYFVDTDEGYDVARKLDIGVKRNIFRYSDKSYTRQRVQYRKISHVGEIVNLMKKSGPTLIVGSNRYMSSLIRSTIVIDSQPDKIRGLTNTITDSLWILGLYPYKTLILTDTLEYAGVPYRHILKPHIIGRYLSRIGLNVFVNDYAYILSYTRFDNVIRFLDSKDKSSIQREVLYSFRYPLPPNLSRIVWYWSNIGKPIFPILAFCIFAAFRRNIIFRHPRANNLAKDTPAEGIVHIITDVLKITDGQMNDSNKIFEYCKRNDLDFDGIYPIFMAIYLSCLANDIPVGKYDGRRFVELLQTLLRSMNWTTLLTSACEIYFPYTGKLPERCMPLVPYSYFV